MVRIYFDMDGVIAKYDRWAYVPGDNGKMPFEDLNAHYFRTLKPDEKMLKVLSEMVERSGALDSNYEVFILSKLSRDPDLYKGQHLDKTKWLKEHAPSFPLKNFYTTTDSKADIAAEIAGRELDRVDVLIDDYNGNLEEWEQRGGLGVKYINGINSENSFSGNKIRKIHTANEIVSILEKAINDLVAIKRDLNNDWDMEV